MKMLADQLQLVKMSVGDEAEHLQELLSQFDMPYDACCSMQVVVDDLRAAAKLIRHVATHLPKGNGGVRRRKGGTPKRC